MEFEREMTDLMMITMDTKDFHYTINYVEIIDVQAIDKWYRDEQNEDLIHYASAQIFDPKKVIHERLEAFLESTQTGINYQAEIIKQKSLRLKLITDAIVKNLTEQNEDLKKRIANEEKN